MSDSNVVATTSSITQSVSTTTVENNLEESDSNGVEVYNPNINNWSQPFWRSVVSVQNGTGSTSKVGTLSIIWVTLAILIYLVLATHGIPSNIMSLGYFSALLICVIYSPAKIIELLQSRFGTGNSKK